MKTELDDALLTAFLTHAADAIEVTDTDLRIEYVNPAFERITGYALSEVVGKTPAEVLRPQDADPAPYETIVATIAAGQVWQGELEAVRKDQTRWVSEVTISPIHDTLGAVSRYIAIKRDITKSKETEDRLRASEARFKDFAETASDWLWETDEEHRFVFLSDESAAYRSPGLPPAVGQSRFELRHAEDQDQQKWDEHRADLDARRPFQDFTYDRPNANGIVRKIKINGRPIFGNGGVFLGYRGTASDISELTSREQELKESELALKALNEELERRVEDRARELAEKTNLLEATFENLSEGFALYDAEDRLVYWNGAYANFVGPIANQLRQGADYETMLRAFIASGTAVYSEADVEALVKERMARHRTSGSNYELEMADGSWVLLRRHETSDGSIVHVHTDITDIKRGEEALRQSERRLSLLMDSVPALFSYIDSEKRYQFTNAQYQRMFGLPAKTLSGKFVSEVLGEKAYAVATPFIDRALSGERIEFDNIVKNAAGESRHLHATYVPDIDESGTTVGAFVLAIDNTESRQRERSLELATAEAARANKAKSEFLSAMSHELRTPLNAILGFAQLLRDYSDAQLTEDQKTNIEHVINGGHHLLNLVNEILDLAKIESVGFDLSLEPINLVQAIRQSLAIAKPLADQRNISLNISPDIPAKILVQADLNRLKQVLLNLISNAIKYNRDKGSVTIAANLTGGGRARITVSDTGPGIPAESHDEVFLPFSRLGVESSKIEGTGIGLTISRQLIENMAGDLDFDSTLGEGSTFWLELPLAESASSQ